MAQLLPPIPKEPLTPDSHIWRDWFNGLRNVLIGAIQGVVSWASINFTGSDIKDIVARSHQDLQNLQGGAAGQYYHLTSTQLTNLGTVTTVSVATSNGFAGTVATATSTPVITLSTSVTGLLKGNGTAISAATSGTDYAPATSGTSILYGNGSGGFSNVTIGTGVSFTTGTLSATGSGGTVTSVTGTAPVVSSGGTTPAISMAAATTSVNGYLTSTDWTTFNNKQASGSYLTTVTSDAPLTGSGTSGSHLIIPAATTSVDGYLTSTDWTTFNNKGSGTVTSVSGTAGRVSSTGGTTPVIDLVSGIASAGTTGSASLIPVVTIDTYGRVTSITTAANPQGTVTSVAAITLGTTGTDLSSTVATSTTTPVITLQVPTASATNRGALSAADWTTFNNKGSGTVTSVTGTAPVVSSGGTTPAISMAAATTSVDGYLTSTDWNTFNGKQAALVSGTNIKTVNSTTLLGSGDVSVGVTSVTGTAPVVSSGGATPAISMAAASTSVSGYLTSTDWNTFNGKQTTLVSGTNIKTVSGITLLGAGDLGTITYAYGGTDQTTVTTGDLLYGSAVNTWSKLAVGTTGQIIRVVAGAPAWGTDYVGTVTSVSGTGTVNGITLTGTVTSTGNLTLGGTLSNVSLATQVTGNLPVTNLNSGTSASGTTFWCGNGTWATPASATYAEGTWTPADGSGASLSFTVQDAKYVKVGRLVTVSAYITYPTTSNTSTATISGLPFTSYNGTGNVDGGCCSYTTLPTILMLLVTNNAQTITIRAPGSVVSGGLGGSYVANNGQRTNIDLSGATFSFTISYTAA